MHNRLPTPQGCGQALRAARLHPAPRGCASGLTRPAALPKTFEKENEDRKPEDKTANGQGQGEDLSPLLSSVFGVKQGMPDGGQVNFGNASPKPAVASSDPFPRAMPDGACGATVGLYSRRSRTEAAFTGLRPAPHPVAALGLSVALGRDPAVAPTPHAPAVNRYVGRVTSLEKLYPDVWLTFNALCKQSGG